MRLRDDQGRIALAWRVVPIGFALFLAANVGALAMLGYLGGRAGGSRLVITWHTGCAAQTLPIMQQRAESMGLGKPRWTTTSDQISLVATMPGLPDDATAVPALLGRSGQLRLRMGDQVLATQADLTAASLEMDEAGMPYTQIVLSPEAGQKVAEAVDANHKGELVFDLDQEELARRPNTIAVEHDKLKIIAGVGKTRDRFRRATDRAIILGHGALPCDLTLASVSDASGSR
ncbi:MAG: hypothetical protein GXP62_13995 [Oligoflexia bacterium]|nr:hypothetical protein [Oligoflexia bacterium]